MADVPSNSFIPKRNSAQTSRRNRGQNFFLLAIISYACLIAAPTASAAVFVYGIYTDRQFERAVVDLEGAIAEFAEADMQRVIEFDKRLTNAQALLDSHVSINQVLSHIEDNTIETVAFSQLSMTRTSSGGLMVEGTAKSDSLDSAYFQRTVYNRENMVGQNMIADVTFTPADEEDSTVAFVGMYEFTAEEVPFVPPSTQSEPVVDTGEVSSTTEATTNSNSTLEPVEDSSNDTL